MGETFKPMLRLVSAAIGAALFALSCAGFNHVSKAAASGIQDQTSFGCICFLGCCFGVLLAFAELNWGLFYFFFGFLRYRVGRASIFAIAGIMMGLIGKNLDDQCRCKTYVILIVEGVACVGMAAVHILAIFVYGNNTKPVIPPNAGAAAGAGYQPSILPPLPKQPPRSTVKNNAEADSGSLQSITVVEPPVPQPTARGSDNPNQPAWMNA
ncbi:hypothetical protein Gpo141_00010149 [Globisporangium polare]